jgi:hypothetical protein
VCRSVYSAIYRDLITRYRVNANLSAEKQLILVSKGKVEYASVLEEKLALLWNKYLEWCDIGVASSPSIDAARWAAELRGPSARATTARGSGDPTLGTFGSNGTKGQRPVGLQVVPTSDFLSFVFL